MGTFNSCTVLLHKMKLKLAIDTSACPRGICAANMTASATYHLTVSLSLEAHRNQIFTSSEALLDGLITYLKAN